MNDEQINQKLRTAVLPIDVVSPALPLGYYPAADLLLIRAGVRDDIYFALDEQNLVRFFESYETMQNWLRRNGYQPLDEEPDPLSCRHWAGASSEKPFSQVLRLVT